MQSWYVSTLRLQQQTQSKLLFLSTQALPDDPELKEVKEVCHSIIQEEQAFIAVSHLPSSSSCISLTS